MKNQKDNSGFFKMVIMWSFLFCFSSFAVRAQTITGTVTDTDNIPLGGANIVVKGKAIGTVTDFDGKFSLDGVELGTILVFSYTGFQSVEKAASENMSIVLQEGTLLDEVVITGVFDERSRMEASVAITTLGMKQLENIVPNSSADLLKNMPGVYVNSSRGEVGNQVYTRGLNLNGGFFYVSMQEDGLPVVGISGLVQPDGFLRADANISRVEGVRGGTASILGPNAPGGIFNYVSRTGGENFQGEVRARFGLEGNGQNPFYRADFNLGGPMSLDKSLTYNIGGFYRNADGPKYPGYTLSFGGQLKANVQKSYESGSIKLFAKYLNDNTAPFEFTPTVDFDDPRTAGNFSNTSSTLIQSQRFIIPNSVSGYGSDIDYDTTKGQSFDEFAIGLDWIQQLGSNWTFHNIIKLSNKENINQTTAVVFPFSVLSPTFYGVSGNLFRFGTYEFYDPSTGNSYGSVSQTPNTNPGPPFVFTPNNLNLPGGEVLPNAVFYNPNPYTEHQLNDFFNQATLSKKLENMTFTGGLYFVRSEIERFTMIPAAQSFATIQDRPSSVGIRYTDLGGTQFDLTNPSGITNIGGGGSYTNDATVRQAALFFGHDWKISEKLNLDWGLRAENFNIKSNFTTPVRLPDNSTGGLDNDPSTLYDVRQFDSSPERFFEKNLDFGDVISYSIGLNYRPSENLAFYGRYSKGNKTPDLSFFMDIANQNLTADLPIEVQDIQMLEGGLKYNSAKLSLFVTPFLTIADNIPNLQIFANGDGTFYAPPRIYQKFTTSGVELEANYRFTDHFNIRAVGIVQGSTADEFGVWLAGANGPDDDVQERFDGNRNDNVGNMFTITPTYTASHFTASVNWQYMGKRWANVANAFELPAFNAFDLNFSYNLSKNLQANASINNVFNTYGIMSWAAPGGFPASLDIQGFTAEMLAANPDAVYASLAIMPRAYFLSMTYRF